MRGDVSTQNRDEAAALMEGLSAELANGGTDSIAPVAALTAIGFALLDVADAIREQTAAEHERQAIVP
jgi:hypothetical protein